MFTIHAVENKFLNIISDLACERKTKVVNFFTNATNCETCIVHEKSVHIWPIREIPQNNSSNRVTNANADQ